MMEQKKMYCVVATEFDDQMIVGIFPSMERAIEEGKKFCGPTAEVMYEDDDSMQTEIWYDRRIICRNDAYYDEPFVAHIEVVTFNENTFCKASK